MTRSTAAAAIDQLDAGPPADSAGPDTLIGGEGFDTVDYGQRTEPLSITLDEVANDGEQGEGDDVRPDVEHVVGGPGNDTIIGTALADTLEGRGGDDRITGLPGDDTLLGGNGERQHRRWSSATT